MAWVDCLFIGELSTLSLMKIGSSNLFSHPFFPLLTHSPLSPGKKEQKEFPKRPAMGKIPIEALLDKYDNKQGEKQQQEQEEHEGHKQVKNKYSYTQDIKLS